MGNRGYVYMLEYNVAPGSAPRCKVGLSVNPESRLRTARTFADVPVQCVRQWETADMAGLEAAMHSRLAVYRSQTEAEIFACTTKEVDEAYSEVTSTPLKLSDLKRSKAPMLAPALLCVGAAAWVGLFMEFIF